MTEPPPLLDRVLRALEEIAPLALAESWDNVGLLLPPSDASRSIGRVFFAIDLTEPVLAEALSQKADLIVAYHPVIFEGKKRLSADRAADRVLLAAIRAGVPVHCPHTSLDVAKGGINDWLCEGIGEGTVAPLEPRLDDEGAGVGRKMELAVAEALDVIVARLKKHLGVERLRVARAGDNAVRSVALCAGAGGAVLAKASHVDLLVTGEMRHHDVLTRVAAGTHVILAEHSSSERGFLAVYAKRLAALVPGLVTLVSERDREPLVSI